MCAADVLEPDEFNTVGLVGGGGGGALQSTSTHEKLRSKENVTEKVSKQVSLFPRPDVLCCLSPFLLCAETDWGGKSMMNQKEKTCLNLRPCFPSLLSPRAAPSHAAFKEDLERAASGRSVKVRRRRRCVRDDQTAVAGVQDPGSLPGGGGEQRSSKVLLPISVCRASSNITARY